VKVGDLVKAPTLMDHDGSVGLVIGFTSPVSDSPSTAAKVLFASGSRYVFPHLLEVINASR
jgi:hypothetical protein